MTNWWLHSNLRGVPILLEVIGTSVLEEAPQISVESEILVNRGVCVKEHNTPAGIRYTVTEIRDFLGGSLLSHNVDSLDPIRIKAFVVFQGPYRWIDLSNPKNSPLLNLVTSGYAPDTVYPSEDSEDIPIEDPYEPPSLSALNYVFKKE